MLPITVLGALVATLASPAIVQAAQSETGVARGPSLGPRSAFAFATVQEGQAVLTRRDEFIAAMSDFDRAARMKSDQAVSEPEFLAFLGRNVRAWSVPEADRLARVCRSVGDRLAGWNLPFPATVLLIKTTGDEEGQAAYTRQNAIILPELMASDAEPALEKLLLHELFHVLSRHQPELRKQLYAVIGFSPVDAIDYPAELRPRRITNPDGYQTGWLIRVESQGRTWPTIPVLYATAEKYDARKGGEFFDYLAFKLLVVTNDSGRWQPRLEGGRPQLLDPQQVQGFFEQIGRNTGYVIHPDEILADNFARLISGDTHLETPRIATDLRRVLRPLPAQP